MFTKPNLIQAILFIDTCVYKCVRLWRDFKWWWTNIDWDDVWEFAGKACFVLLLTFGVAISVRVVTAIYRATYNSRMYDEIFSRTLLLYWAILIGVVVKGLLVRWVWRRVVRWAEEQQKLVLEIAQKLEGKGGPT